MALSPFRYQLAFFSGNLDIPVKADVILKLTQLYSAYELIPSTFQEIGIGLAGPVPRVRLSSISGEWGIDLASDRIDIEKVPTDQHAKNMGSEEAFCTEALTLLGLFLKTYPRKAARVAFVLKGIVPDDDEGKMRDRFEALFKTVPYYGQNPSFEWINRVCGSGLWKRQAEVEHLNVISTVIRGKPIARGGLKGELNDRIIAEFDVNTKPEWNAARFDLEDTREFAAMALGTIRELQKQYGFN